jgi:hypothetical protein
MAKRANRLDGEPVVPIVSSDVVVLVSPLAALPHMRAIRARNRAWMWKPPSPNGAKHCAAGAFFFGRAERVATAPTIRRKTSSPKAIATGSVDDKRGSGMPFLAGGAPLISRANHLLISIEA